MKLILSIVAMIFSASSYAGPTNAQMNQLWLFSTYIACIAQNSAYESTPIAATLMSTRGSDGWEAFRAQPRAQCLRARQWIPKTFCDEVVEIISLDERGPRPKLFLTEKHQEATEIEPVLNLYNDSTNSSEPFTCPIQRPSK